MPKVTARVLATKIENGKFLGMVRFNGKLPPKGMLVSVSWGKRRSELQNNLYWLYLTFLWEDCNLKEKYLTIEELHETLKATLLSERIVVKGLEIIKVGSTASLDKIAFGEYIDRIDKAMAVYHNVDSGPFWLDYEENYKMG